MKTLWAPVLGVVVLSIASVRGDDPIIPGSSLIAVNIPDYPPYDVMIEVLELSPNPPAPALEAVFTIRVQNAGKNRSLATKHYLLVEKPGSKFQQGPKGVESMVPALEPGASCTLNVKGTIDLLGPNRATSTLEHGKSDTNQANDTKSIAFTVSPPAPDFVVDSLQIKPKAPRPTTEITFTATVRNAGTADASASQFELTIGNSAAKKFSVPALKLGKSHTVTHRATLDNPIRYGLKAEADATNQVAEGNEKNNVKDRTFEVFP